MSTKKERQGRAVEGEGNVHPIAMPPFDVGAPRIWVTDDDELVFNYRTHESTIDVTHTLRVLRLDGSVDHIQERVTLTASGKVASHVIQLGDGWLVGVKINHNGNVIRGRIWAFFELRYGLTGGTFSGVQLAAGYLTNISRVSWPYGGLHHSLEGVGETFVITPSNPANGTEHTETVPTMERWRLDSILWRLLTDATAANRFMRAEVERGGTVILSASHRAVVGASSSGFFRGFRGGVPEGGNEAVQQTSLFDVILAEGDVIRTKVDGIQSGDSIRNIAIVGQRWLEEQS